MKTYMKEKLSTLDQRQESTGYNTQYIIPPGLSLTPEQKEKISKETTKIATDRDEFKEIKTPTTDNIKRKPRSARISIPLKERGRILSRQFGSLTKSLQMKLLGDPCFLNAFTCRIQIYMQWG